MEQLQSLWSFLVIDNFSGFTTILTGSIAWLVYASQKRDKKINAARVILSEIRTAENKIDEITGLLERNSKGFPSVLPVNSWIKYSHLFASSFDQDQLGEINNFYSICESIEEAAKRDNNYFWLTTEHISQIGQTKAADMILASLNKDLTLNEEKLSKLTESVLTNISKHPYIYSPQKTTDMLVISISKVSKITTSSTGIKLKMIANLPERRFSFYNPFKTN